MWTDRVYLGSGPAEENIAQVGSPNYEERAHAECRAFIEAIKKVVGEPPLGARLKIVRQAHDFGSYIEVACEYQGENRAAAEYAAACDDKSPTRWEDAGMESPGSSKPKGGEKTYHGKRDDDGTVHVWVEPEGGDPYPLPMRLDLRNHSPSGFNHGYSGSGPSQLSLALLADALGDAVAERHYQEFKRKVVARIDGDEWEMTSRDVRKVVEGIERERGAGWGR
jgi:hypothetical protein